MIDIHNHLLWGVDDGAKDFASALTFLQEACEDGVKKVIVTPHFMKHGPYRLGAAALRERFAAFKEAVGEEVDIELFLGNELYIDKELDDLLLEGAILSLDDSRYVLVEFPFGEYRDEYDEYLYNLRIAGFRVIIAHPERYKYVNDDKNFVKRWTDNGYLLQINQNSLNNHDKRHMIYDWIMKGYVYFIASDAHNEYRPCILSDAYKNIVKNFNKDIAERLLVNNPECILENKDISEMPIIKKKFLGIF